MQDRYRRTLRAIEQLPQKYRIVLVLRVQQGLSYIQIAETLGLPVATVETRLVRVRRMLRDKLLRGEQA